MGNRAPKPDNSLQRERVAQEQEAKRQADLLAQQQAEDEARRRSGLIGRRALVSATDLGFPVSLGTSQG